MMDDAPVGGGDVGGASNKYGHILIDDPNNQPYIGSIADVMQRQADLGVTKLSSEFFSKVQEDYIVAFLKDKHPDIHDEFIYNAKSPLDQFEIRNLISLDVPILGYLRIFVTNIAFYLVTATVIALTFNLLGTNKDKIVANY